MNELSAFFTRAMNSAGGICVPFDVRDSFVVFAQCEGVIVQAELGTVSVIVSPI